MDDVGADKTVETGQPDSALPNERGRRGPSPRIRKGLVADDVLSGREPYVGRSMVKHGLSPTTALNPSANGYGLKALAEAHREVFPDQRKTLRSLRPKAINVLDKGITLEENERPDAVHLQASALALKLMQEDGEEDDGSAQRSATYYARADRRRGLHAWMRGARFVARLVGELLDEETRARVAAAVAGRAQELEARTEVRAPYLDALLPPRPPAPPLQKVFQHR